MCWACVLDLAPQHAEPAMNAFVGNFVGYIVHELAPSKVSDVWCVRIINSM